MTRAIKNKIGMDAEEAEKIAHLILDTFGYESRIIDNILTPNERQIFYMLQSEGFLSTSRERSRLHDGREWMTHYWKLQRKTIYHCAQNGQEQPVHKPVKNTLKKKKKESVYTQITDDMWTMRKILKADSVSTIS